MFVSILRGETVDVHGVGVSGRDISGGDLLLRVLGVATLVSVNDGSSSSPVVIELGGGGVPFFDGYWAFLHPNNFL